MPFKSLSQMKYLYSQKPSIAKEFAKKTHDFKSLPEHIKKKAMSMAAKRV